MIFDKGAKKIQWGISSINGARKTGQSCKRMTLDHYLIPFTIVNSKRIKDFNIRTETIKLLDENTRGKLLVIGLMMIFFLI